MNLLASFSMNDILMNSLVSISVVFLALLILVLVFSYVGKTSKRLSEKRRLKAENADTPTATVVSGDVPGVHIAAISMALHLYFDDAHDIESNIITIKRTQKRYSPWNSKIYGITNLNR